MNYQDALAFIGEVRAGMSWERFCFRGVRHSDAFIDILNDGEDARKFLSSSGISREYLSDQIRGILHRLHFNRENDHYLTLALAHDASEPQINKRWKELMLLYHPDRNRDEEAALCAAKINEAYSVLKSPEKRREYDRSARQSPEGRHPGKEMGKFRAPRPKEYIIASPRTRRILSKLIIPSCLVIAGVILLVIFLENREVRYVYHVASTGREDNQQHAPAGKAQAKEAEEVKVHGQVLAREEVQEAKTKIKEEAKARAEIQEKGEVKGKGERTEAKAEVRKPEQARSREEIKIRADEKPAVQAQAKAQEERKERVKEEAKGEAKGEAGTETSQPKSYDPPRESGGKVAGPLPAGQQVMARAEPEGMESAAAHFISRYANAYEEGDIEKFMTFFSKSVIENGRMSYEDIRSAYKKNFENNRYRYSLRNVRYRKSGDDVIVTASYVINKSLEKGEVLLVQGDIRWTLCRESGGLKIVKVDYERK